MDFIRWAMNRPVTISVCVLLTVMFGLLSLFTIPVQLTPTVDKPVVTVTTMWPGRSPEEVVNEITREQEKYLKNVTNLKHMRSVTSEGTVEITLEFYLGADLSRALQEVSDSLRRVPAYPEEVDEPTIKAAGGGPSEAIAWIIIDLDPKKIQDFADYDISTLFDALDREVKPYLERIDGVAEVDIYGGREREVQVLVDPVALAQRGLSHEDVVAAMRGENRNVSAGTIAEGKRDYRVRLMGQYTDPAEVLNTVITYRDGRPVLIRDVATVEVGHQKRRGFVRSMGHPCLAMPVIRQSGANVMTVMADVRARLVEVQEEILPRLEPRVGKHLRIRQVYDETTYIDAAIALVTGNLWTAATITIVTLLIFLRSVRPTLIIAVAIPVCMTGTFLVMVAAGRTLNVVSLAALAFATGVVVDASNVVIDNIERRLGMGEPVGTAVYLGTREVWGAVLAGGLTTACVFVPVLTIKEEVGQLFFDISFAMGSATLISLLVAIVVVPAAANVLYRGRSLGTPAPASGVRRLVTNLFGLVPVGLWIGVRVADAVRWMMTSWRGWTVRPAVIVLVTVASLWGAMKLMPPLDYLPKGNRNLVFGGVLIPPGLSVEEQGRYADRMDVIVGPYLTDRQPESMTLEAWTKTLPPIDRYPPSPPFDPVAVSNYFVGAFGGSMFAGAVSADEQAVIPVGQLLSGAMSGLPDAFGGASQSSIFTGIEGGNTINVEISGTDLDRVKAAAGMVMGMAGQRFGFGTNVRPNPSNFNLSQPEWRLRLTPVGRELGLRTTDLGVAVRALFDGALAGEYLHDGRNIDLMVKPSGGRLEFKEQLANVPVMTPAGRRVPISQVAEFIPANAPQSIQRIEELASVTIQVEPPTDMTIEEVMSELNDKMISVARAAGVIDPTMRVRLEGTAAKLDEVKRALFGASAPNPVRRAMFANWGKWGTIAVGVIGIVVAVVTMARAAKRRSRAGVPAVVMVILTAFAIGGLVWAFMGNPELLAARFVWALAVTYLLMCALFEDYLLPLVIMFSVPVAMVGGFASLSLVHHATLKDPTIAPQQLDVLTMLGFVILIGTVVNNAILLVEQSINFMNPAKFGSDAAPMSMPDAIRESVRTRIRPIMMTTMTTVGGGLPLVLAPGAGSEMYRGLGAVVVGGLACSTVFTLFLVPLVLSLQLDCVGAFRSVWSRKPSEPGASTPTAA